MDLNEMREKHPALTEKGEALDTEKMLLRKQLRDTLEQNDQMRTQLQGYQEDELYQQGVMDGLHLMERHMLDKYNVRIVDGRLLDLDTGRELKSIDPDPEFMAMTGMRPMSKEELEEAQAKEKAETLDVEDEA